MHTLESNCTLLRFCSGALIIFALLAVSMPSVVMAGRASPFGALEWNELVPDDWQPPLILPAPPEDGSHPEVDSASLVEELDEKKISIAGFMVPTKFDSNIVSEFVLVPFLEQHVQGHMHHDSNQMVYVYLQEPRAIQSPYTPVLVKGEMKVRSVDTDEGPTGYVIEQGLMEDYTY
jgi:hypothetical protein